MVTDIEASDANVLISCGHNHFNPFYVGAGKIYDNNLLRRPRGKYDVSRVLGISVGFQRVFVGKSP